MTKLEQVVSGHQINGIAEFLLLEKKSRVDFATLQSKQVSWINARQSLRDQSEEDDIALNEELRLLKAELKDVLIDTIHLPLDLILADPDGNPIGVLGMFKTDNSLRVLSAEILRSLGFPFITVTAEEVSWPSAGVGVQAAAHEP